MSTIRDDFREPDLIEEPKQLCKNVLLYWDDENRPSDILRVVDTWEEFCPNWKVSLFNAKKAFKFFEENFEADVLRAFHSCALPAMRSDFFRVFWILKNGGIYSDVRFTAMTDPTDLLEGKKFACFRWHHGRIINGLFYANKSDERLQIISENIHRNVKKRSSNNVWLVTGPEAWIESLRVISSDTYSVFDHREVFGVYFKNSEYASSTRNSKLHWSVAQTEQSIFR